MKTKHSPTKELFEQLGGMLAGLPEPEQRKLLSEHLLRLMYMLVEEDRNARRNRFELLLAFLLFLLGVFVGKM